MKRNFRNIPNGNCFFEEINKDIKKRFLCAMRQRIMIMNYRRRNIISKYTCLCLNFTLFDRRRRTRKTFMCKIIFLK